MTEIPERMRHLPRDRRGYPVPVIIMRDPTGLPLFTVNDTNVQRRCAEKKLCPICGERLTRELWFVGGPQSAFHPRGKYFDSAMHHECMTFALLTCPYLALPGYRSHIEDQIPHLANRLNTTLVEHTMIPGRPKLLVAVMAFGQRLEPSGSGSYYIAPLRPYHAVEFWGHGAQIEFGEGMRQIRRIPDLELGALRLVERDRARSADRDSGDRGGGAGRTMDRET